MAQSPDVNTARDENLCGFKRKANVINEIEESEIGS